MVKMLPPMPEERILSMAISRNYATSETVQTDSPSLPMIGLLALEMIVGYEWLVSGLTKLVRGDFPSGLAGELSDKLPDLPAWYAGFLSSVVIPNAKSFAYVIELAELLAGVALIVGPLIWLCFWRRISGPLRRAILIGMIVAAIGGIFMAVNFHVANGGTHPWLLPSDSFDEGVDLDALLTAISVVIAAVNISFLKRLSRR